MDRTLRLVLIALLVVATGCVRFSITDTNKFNRGMSVAKVLGIVSKGPVEEFDITISSEANTTLHVLQFDMNHGGISGDYFLVFKSDKLLYWGYPHEFNRYPDRAYNEIGEAVVKHTDD